MGGGDLMFPVREEQRPVIRLDEEALFALPEVPGIDPEEKRKQELFTKLAIADSLEELEALPFEELLDMYSDLERLCEDITTSEGRLYERVF
ncbi:MAG: hypothetical protein IKI87_09540, partial [Clostridiales bacterium]|nr:hypothetical protein [Clostridiales bacterium]